MLELVLGKLLDAAIVGAVLVFNAGLGFVQQQRAAAALELLRHRLAVNARVCRDGAWQQVPAAELVDGDLVHVRVGDLAPADGPCGNFRSDCRRYEGLHRNWQLASPR